jgi:hypothetical protein
MLCEDTPPAKSVALHASCVKPLVRLIAVFSAMADCVDRFAPLKLLLSKPRSAKMEAEEQPAMIST